MQKLHNIWSHLLDAIFPRPPIVQELEEMSIGDYRTRIPKPEHIDNRTISLFAYDSEYTRALVWHIKYRGNKKLAQKAAEALHEEIVETLSERSLFENFVDPLLIPIPLSKKKFRERGFNQSEMIANKLQEILGHTVQYEKNMLIKIRDTEAQSHTRSKTERLSNLSGCFEVTSPEKLAGRNVILLDDVITTGATTAEASRTLKNAGAKKILRISIAH